VTWILGSGSPPGGVWGKVPVLIRAAISRMTVPYGSATCLTISATTASGVMFSPCAS